MHILIIDLSTRAYPRHEMLSRFVRLLEEKNIKTTIACLGDGPLAEYFKNNGISYAALPGKSIYNPSLLVAMTKCIKRNRYDIIHLFGKNAIYAARLGLRLSSFEGALFISVGGSTNESLPSSRLLNDGCLASKKINKIFCSSVYTLEKMVQSGISRELLSSLPVGIDGECTKSRLPRSAERFVFLASAQLVPENGLINLIEALPLLSGYDDLPFWEIRIVGDGPDFGKLLERARQLGVDSHICLLGRQNTESQLACSDVAVVTNLYPNEHNTFILQAMRACVPLICSNVSTNIELIGKEKNALVFAAKNSAALGSAMLRSMIDSNLYRRLCMVGVTEFPKHTHKAICESMYSRYLDAIIIRSEEYN